MRNVLQPHRAPLSIRQSHRRDKVTLEMPKGGHDFPVVSVYYVKRGFSFLVWACGSQAFHANGGKFINGSAEIRAMSTKA